VSRGPDQSSGFALRYALEHERPLRGARAGVALIWLLFIIFPLANAIGTPGPTLEHGLTIAGAIIFVATCYMWSWCSPGAATSAAPFRRSPESPCCWPAPPL
jgi:hypothetical protein